MKRMRSFFLGLALIVSLIAAPTMAIEEPYVDDTAYQYPLQAGTQEWASFGTKAEKLALLQIPEDKLSAMTTRALLETVLAYPYIQDFLYFNTLKGAFDTVMIDFNGFKALLGRPDVTEVLLSAYREAGVISSDEFRRTEVSSDDFFLASTVEFLIASDEMMNGVYTQDEMQELHSIEAQKTAEREESGLYSSYSNILERQRMQEQLKNQ